MLELCFTLLCMLVLVRRELTGKPKRTINDTHREKAPSNKTQALIKSMNMGVWVIGILNQLFRRSSYNRIKFSKK